jgi:pyruvate dehydrogenase E1 component beta subunit
LIVVNEGPRAGGFASEVVARTLDNVPFGELKAAPVRVTAKDTPIPYAAGLERAVLPSVDDLLAAVAVVMGR